MRENSVRVEFVQAGEAPMAPMVLDGTARLQVAPTRPDIEGKTCTLVLQGRIRALEVEELDACVSLGIVSLVILCANQEEVVIYPIADEPGTKLIGVRKETKKTAKEGVTSRVVKRQIKTEKFNFWGHGPTGKI